MTGKRNFSRKSGFRDAKLIIIAAEGEETEKIYFEGLKNYYSKPRVHVEVLERPDSGSDPSRVMKVLDGFRSTYKLRRGYDQLWVVIDVDRWGTRKLVSVSQQCVQKNYLLAVSNPAFELWLLMHIQALNMYSQEELHELLNNRKENNRTRLEREIVHLLGSYNKSKPDMTYFCPRVYLAIANARSMDDRAEDRWPNNLGTRVYLLAEQLIPDEIP